MLPHADRHLPFTQRPHTRCSHTRSLSLTPCLSHTHTLLTPVGALTRGVSFTHRASHTRAVSGCGAPFTHGVPGSTHAGTPATTPLAHGVSLARGVSSTHGVALTLVAAHGVAHGVSLVLGGSSTHGDALGVSSKHGGTLTLVASRTQRLTLPVCVRRSTHFATLVNTHRDTTHTGTTLATTHTGTLILGTTLSLASTRAPGVFTPPKLRVHPSAALTSSTSRGTT